MAEFQVCSKCKQHLSLSKYYKTKVTSKNKLGRQHYCKKCQSKYQKSNSNKYGRKLSSNDIRKAKLKYRFGITIKQYDKLFEKQNGVCAICNMPEIQKHQNGAVLRLAIDHKHSNNKIRGLLCKSCNLMLGNAKENIDILLNAIKYLGR